MPSLLQAIVTLSPGLTPETALAFENGCSDGLPPIGPAPEAPLAIVSFDADRIHDYVFASSRPLDISGASFLVEDFTRLDGPARPHGVAWALERSAPGSHAIVFAAGGSGVVIVPVGLGETVSRALEASYRELTAGATLTAVALPCWHRELIEPGPFEQLWTRLGRALRDGKARKMPREAVVWPGFLARCGACALAPAEHPPGRGPEDEEELLCGMCKRRRQTGRDRARRDRPEALSLNDFRDGASAERGTLAVVYMDGNGMGRIWGKLGGIQALQRVSGALRALFEGCVDNVVDRLGLAGDGKRRGRYQSPVVGGDDVLLMLPARSALAATEWLIQEIRGGLVTLAADTGLTDGARKAVQKVGMSAGLVVAPAHFPIRFLVDYASALLGNAKRESYRIAARRKAKSPPGVPAAGTDLDCVFALDFEVIKDTSPLSLDIPEARKRHSERLGAGGRLFRLTGRPYEFEVFQDRVLRHLKAFEKIPRSQTYALRQWVLERPEEARLNFLYQVAREGGEHSKRPRHWRPFLQAVMGTELGRWEEFLCRKRVEDGRRVYESSYLDFMDLVELIQRTGGAS